MITNKKIKTAPESIHYLNEVVLGMSSSNGVIAKDYTSAFPVQKRLDDLEEKSNDTLVDISTLNGIVEELLMATEDTGWQPLEMTNASVNMSTTNMFIRKVGNVVALAGIIHFSSAYSPYSAPGSWLARLPLAYRPTKEVAGFCIKYAAGVESQTIFRIRVDGYLELTTAQANGDRVDISGFTYFAQ